MVTKKDLAIEKTSAMFEEFSNLILVQLSLLNKYIEADANDATIRETIFANEEKINNYEIRLDNQITKALVLYKPVASNLRQLIATYRMVINLERVGDYTVKIVKKLDKVKEEEAYAKSKKVIQRFAKISSKMISDALYSFEVQDKDTAIKVIKDDAHIDGLYQKLVTKTVNSFDESQDLKELFLSLSRIRSILSSIERIGNQASNVAEISIYSMLGINVKHQDVEELDD